MHSQAHEVRWTGVIGGLFGACGVALSAYAAHAASPTAQRSLYIAAAITLVHGVLLVSWVPGRRPGRVAAAMITLGVLLFAGSLVAAYAFGVTTRFVPAGGMSLILGWLLVAISRGRG